VEWHGLVPAIMTERLVLRIAVASDVDALLKFSARNVGHFQAWMPESALRPSRKDLLASFADRQDLARSDRGYRFNLFLRRDPVTVVGLCSVSDIRRGVIQQCVLGYAMDKDFQGKGLMKEAVAGAIRFAFEELDLHRIEGSFMPENLASAAILASFGFKQQGYFTEYLLLDKKWRDHVVTFLVNPDWKGVGRRINS
jgi:ribosomal-protein-alanine N-acetyltransferase